MNRPPSDLEHACEGYRQGLVVLATHLGPLAERLRQAAFDCLVNSGPWARSHVPRETPDFSRPARDLPDDLRERVRVVGDELTRSSPPSEARLLALAAEVVALEADLRAALADQRRRQVSNLGMAVDSQALLATPSDDDLLRSGAWNEEHLIVLGRIIEVSAENETTARRLLGRAMGVPESNFGNQQYVDAVFLGSRLNDLRNRVVGLSRMEGLPDWLPDVVAWVQRAAAADERRNQLVHRPPVLITRGAAGVLPGMAASRRNQTAEVLSTQAWDLLRELDAVRRASFVVLRASSPQPA